jgi:hypothetical protein
MSQVTFGNRRIVPNRETGARVHLPRNSRFESCSSDQVDLDKSQESQESSTVLRRASQIESGRTGQDMKIVTGLLAAVLLLAGVGASHAIVRIADDRGGRIGTYIDKYQGLRSSNESIMIDGLCASACTIVLGAVSPDRICVTSRANLGFHAAWDFGARGQAVTNPEATRMLFAMYPPNIRRWINQRGGLKTRMIFLSGRQLASMYRPCYMDAQASSRRRN